MRKTIEFDIPNITVFKAKLLNWSKQFSCFAMLDSSSEQCVSYPELYRSRFDLLIGIGCHSSFNSKSSNIFEDFKKYSETVNDWLIGHLAYDLKNQTEKLHTRHENIVGFSDLYFFQPQILIEINNKKAYFRYLETYCNENDAKDLIENLLKLPCIVETYSSKKNIIKARVSKKEYKNKITNIQHHIAIGNIYETNYCIEFYNNNLEISPEEVYIKLNKISPAPYSAFYKMDNKYAICSSPERFLQKTGMDLISQPIKGTMACINNNLEEKQALYENKKERIENIMIVDLVRNDLSHSAQSGSVKVDELCGVYSYAQVHQMISTISSKLKLEMHWIDAIKYSFPMGSMTGVPKFKAMQLCDHFENSRRGLYSGAIGYINPNQDFDFNVVIRTIMYNKSEKYVSFHTGSAITIASNPEQEYQECLLKAKALLIALNAEIC